MKAASFPSAGQAFLVLLAYFLVQLLVYAFLDGARHALGLTDEQVMSVTMVLSGGLVVAGLQQFARLPFRTLLHSGRASARVTALLLVPPVLALIPLILALDDGLMRLLQTWLPMSSTEERAFERLMAPGVATALTVCVLAPLVEEFLFRGLMLRAFLLRYPRGRAIAYSALYFGAAHLNVYQFCFAFGLGLLLGWLYERSQSLIPCLALHVGLNTVVYVLGQSASLEEAPTADVPLWFWTLALLLAAAGAAALRRLLTGPRATG